MGTLPSTFKEIRLPKKLSHFPTLLQVGISLWLVSQAGLASYRFFVTAKGFEYPYHVQYPGHTYKTYDTKYAWDIHPFLEQIQKAKTPEVWVSTENVFADNFWALILDQKARVLAVQPVPMPIRYYMNSTDLLFNSNLLTPPDFILISNSTWNSSRWVNPDWKPHPVLYQDERYSLVEITRQYPEHVLLIGMRSDPYFLQIQVNPEFIISNNANPNDASFQFLSPKACRLSISAEAFIYPQGLTATILQVDSRPSDNPSQVEIRDTQNVQILVNLDKGYNFISIKIISSVPSKSEILTIALTNLRFTEVGCSSK